MTQEPSKTPALEVIPSQLSLRAYFVAHAPAAPNSFKPVLPEVKWPESLPSGSRIAVTAQMALDQDWSREETQTRTYTWDISDIEPLLAYLDQYYLAVEQEDHNSKNEALERVIQWPLYWADAMIERLGH